MAKAKRRQNDENIFFMGDNDSFFEETNRKHDKRTPSNAKYRKNIVPKTDNQASLISEINNNHIVLAMGPAGTGKTYISVAKAVDEFKNKNVERIILTRPAIEAGEKLGFLPGDLEEKLDPYMRPLFDALLERMDPKKLDTCTRHKTIEIAPVAFMRGRNLNNSFIVVDEAQNCTEAQLKMIMTRLGWNSKMIITGDPDQSDLPPGESGLKTIMNKIGDNVKNVSICKLEKEDIVRHPVVSDLLNVI
jgi:phosphate starvation-inducible PhoH-like protein